MASQGDRRKAVGVMRIIDADALVEFIDLGHLRNPLESCYSERDVVDMLESRPTLDYKDFVPQGEWEFVKADENDMPIYRCTNCKTKRYGRPNFCSNCGANMRKRRESEC